MVAKMTELYEINESLIHNIINFLTENEEYGDDWKAEIDELERLLDV